MAIGVWEHEDDDAVTAADLAAANRPAAPDLEVEEVSERGAHFTVQVVSGMLRDPRSLLWVAGRGAFEVVRIEPWRAPDGAVRVLLVLRAFSRG